MADQLQLRGGTTAQTATFTGALREVTVDTDKDTLVVHDNALAGGYPLLRQDLSNLPAGTIDNADINASAAIVDTKLATIATALKVSNSATTAASANTASAIVARDASGNFTAGTITAALTGAASSNVLKAGDTMTGVLAVTAGTAALPGIAVSGDLNTGLFSPGADQLAITTGGTSRLAVSTTAVSSTLAVDVPLGAVGTPSLTFTGDLNTGLFSPGADTLALVTGGTNRVHVTSGGLVGIATSSPSNQLTVGANGTSSISLDWTGDNAAKATFSANHSTGEVRIGATNNSGTYFTTLYSNNNEAVRIDSSRRLLVGTSSALPVYYDGTSTWQGQFQVARSDQNAIANFSIWNSTASTYTNYGGVQLHLSACRSGTVGTHTSGALTSGDTIGSITFDASDGTNFRNSARIEAIVDGGVSTGDVPGRLVFSTTADGAASPTERMRITSDGKLFVGTTSGTGAIAQFRGASSPAVGASMSGTSVQGTAALQISKPDTTNTTSQVFAQFYVNDYTTGSGQINANGAGAAAFGSFSDIRLKENVANLEPQLEKILALRPVEFDYIESEGGGRQVGFIAQELQEVYPDCVGERQPDGMLTLTGWSKTEARLVKAIHEQQAMIVELQAKVAALEAS